MPYNVGSLHEAPTFVHHLLTRECNGLVVISVFQYIIHHEVRIPRIIACSIHRLFDYICRHFADLPVIKFNMIFAHVKYGIYVPPSNRIYTCIYFPCDDIPYVIGISFW